MTLAEVFEDVRTILREVQVPTVEDPWEYEDEDLIMSVRSALRRVKAAGVNTTITVDPDGTASADFDDNHGVLLAYRIVAQLLRGDLVQKMNEGYLGIYFRSGTDIIDTKSAINVFKSKADEFMDEYEVLLAGILTDQEDGPSNHFGGQTTTLT